MAETENPMTETRNTDGIPTARTKGEVKVWLSAAGLSIGLLMVLGLLSLITYNGISVFWPKPVYEVELASESGERSKLAGELIKTQTRRNAGSEDVIEEMQFFIGNKDAYGMAFRYFDSKSVKSKEQPEDIIVAERMEYGDSIFYPVSLTLKDGEVLKKEGDGFKRHLRKLVKEANARRAKILHIEKKEIGNVNSRIRSAELKIRGLEKSSAKPEETEKKVATLREKIANEQEVYQELAAKARELREEQKLVVLEYRLASGEVRTQPVGDLVHFYYANQLGLFGKIGVFLHHIKEFITAEPREANTEGGIFPAIFGTFVMTILMAVMVTPFGVIAAIYLREYAKQGMLVRIVRICVNNLAGVPSIVFGVFGLGFFVYGVGSFIDGGPEYPMPPVWWFLTGIGFIGCTLSAVYLSIQTGSPLQSAERAKITRIAKPVLATLGVLFGIMTLVGNPYFDGFFSNALPTPTFGTGGILWASLTLSLMTLPVVIVATEEALAAVPRGVREAALACGASKWQMIQRVVLPSALPGVMTGVILAMARGAGEVAPLMITGVVKLAPSLPLDFEAPFVHAERKFMHLGFHIYDLGFQSPDSEAAKPMVFATTLLLILLVVVMNLFAIRIRSKLQKKYQASAF
tara:strand:- start:10524 stop:12422 length:1899 start_codon:yes stop_codon:yes gene_type:complete